MCSCSVELYTEKRFGPASEPCGTQQSSGLSDEYEHPIFTLQYLGYRYESNHFKAVWSTPNLVRSTCRSTCWSMVSKAALRFHRHIEHISYHFMAHRISLKTHVAEVSQL